MSMFSLAGNAENLLTGRRILPHAKSTRRMTVRVLGQLMVLAVALLILTSGVLVAEKPELDPSYVNGEIYYMIGPRLITDPDPNLFAKSEELYLIAYPINPTGSTTLGTLTLPSGYKPNCDPCFHPGLPPVFAYHDHVLTGAPGLGTDGTARVFKAPWKIIVLMYNPVFALDPHFKPITSASDIDAAEAAGKFVPLVPGAENPYEINTGNVLICPLVSPHA